MRTISPQRVKGAGWADIDNDGDLVEFIKAETLPSGRHFQLAGFAGTVKAYALTLTDWLVKLQNNNDMRTSRAVQRESYAE